MSRIKNRNSVPSIPIIYKAPNGGVVEWRPAREPFSTWVRRVWDFSDGNQLERPTEDALDELACSQFPHWVCDGDRRAMINHSPPPLETGKRKGCCGGMR